MIRRITSFVLIAIMVLWAVPAITMAQAPQPYVVQQGDTGWELARTYYDDPVEWRAIVKLNPFLQQPNRIVEREGKIILLLKPGEELFGLERLNVPAPTAVPITELVSPAPPVTEAATEQSTA